jgi:hypothetical protein
MRQKSGPEKQPAEEAIKDHPTGDASTLFGRGEQHCRTLSPGVHRLVDVLWLANGVPGGRQTAARGRHNACHLGRREGSPPGGAGAERGRG